ncbi:hypothetical protein MNB_SV-6-344 [hydrothermal vent metagenome]|uniref:Co-chaperone DjlA N-terminal domain-containing protein n=1 Tax=hydrothermal vent metagenome TaxID=652676 RepID=A0A1W1CGI4_9ZZZZ
MEKTIKRSVATLLAHIIKIDNRDIEKEAPVFCRIMEKNFECNQEEAYDFLVSVMQEDYDLDEHISVISDALCGDQLSKMHLMEEINHIIYSDTITEQDYKEFEKIKEKLFVCD